MAKTLQQKIVEAEQQCAKFLADGNEAADRGNQAKAEKLYEKSQQWLDKLNELQGWN